MAWWMSVLVVVGGGVGLPQRIEHDAERLRKIVQSLEAWQKSLREFDVYYVSHHEYFITSEVRQALEGAKTPCKIPSTGLKFSTACRAARSGERRRDWAFGPRVSRKGLTEPIVEDQAYDGTKTFLRDGKMYEITPGASRVVDFITPVQIIGVDRLVERIERWLRLGAKSGLARVMLQDLPEGRVRVAFEYRSGSCRTDKYDTVLEKYVHFLIGKEVYVVDTKLGCLPIEKQVYQEDGTLIAQAKVEYKRFGSGVLYPLRGVQEEFSASGELRRRRVFEVDDKKTKLNPPEGLPDTVFQIEIPDNATVRDVRLNKSMTGAQLRRLESTASLRQVGRACVLYAAEHGGKWPPDLETIAEQELISLPSSAGSAREVLSRLVYVAGQSDKDDPRNVVMYEAPRLHQGKGTYVLFLDGRIAWLSISALEKALAETYARLGLERPAPASRVWAAQPASTQAAKGGD